MSFASRAGAAGLSVLAAALGLAPASALALGGLATGGGALESRTVMVLGSRGNACTGTMIAPTVVLTAAHCVTGAKEYAIAYYEGGSPTLQAVRQVARHPGFRAGSAVSVDLALVRLALPLPERFSPVVLDSGTELVPGQTKTIAGFGVSGPDDVNTQRRLRVADVVVLDRVYPRFMRLGSEGGRVAICKGDSGGPVLSDADGEMRVVGVVYAAERVSGFCGRSAQAVRVAPQRAWIDGVLRGWGVR
jgi:secreted trypsin-like serine protease